MHESNRSNSYIKAITGTLFAIIIILSGLDRFELTKENLILCGLLLLLVIIAELTEFNVWGFKGKTKVISDATEMLSGESINIDADRNQVTSEELSQPLHLMNPDIGNFLAIVFEIERLLRIYSESMGQKNAQTIPLSKLINYLNKNDVITDAGKMRLESISALRNFLVHGRNQEVDESDLQSGFELANNFYQELYNNMFNEEGSK